MSFWCHRLDQNTNEKFSRISALASKTRSNQKNKGTFYRQLEDFILTLLHYLFWFDLFLEAKQKIFVGFFGRFDDTKRTFWN